MSSPKQECLIVKCLRLVVHHFPVSRSVSQPEGTNPHPNNWELYKQSEHAEWAHRVRHKADETGYDWLWSLKNPSDSDLLSPAFWGGLF